MTEQDKYNELSYYTLSHNGEEFIHQHVVDAFIVQTATDKTKFITFFFALAGLCLYVKKNYNGRQVQEAHELMAKNKTKVINIFLPENRGDISIGNVLDAEPGIQRDEMIKQWCISVWNAYSSEHEKIIHLTKILVNEY